MSTYRLTHLDDATLLSGLTTLVARDRSTTAELIAHIAEVDCDAVFDRLNIEEIAAEFGEVAEHFAEAHAAGIAERLAGDDGKIDRARLERAGEARAGDFDCG